MIAGAGSNCTATAVQMSKEAAEAGADGVLLVTPYYNKANDEGMIRHFTTVADQVHIPIILYNIPGRTGCTISLNALKQLSKHPMIQGIKEASGDISYATNAATLLNDDFVMYSGNDDIIVPMMALGSSGVISVLADVLPKTTHDIVFNCLNGNYKTAQQLQLDNLDLIHDLFMEVNPIPVKEALNMMGFHVGKYRLPLYEMSEDHKAKLEATLKARGLIA